jgi:hypothetical protein
MQVRETAPGSNVPIQGTERCSPGSAHNFFHITVQGQSDGSPPYLGTCLNAVPGQEHCIASWANSADWWGAHLGCKSGPTTTMFGAPTAANTKRSWSSCSFGLTPGETSLLIKGGCHSFQGVDAFPVPPSTCSGGGSTNPTNGFDSAADVWSIWANSQWTSETTGTTTQTTATTTTTPGKPGRVDVGKTVLLARRTKTSGCKLRPDPDRRCSPGAYYSKLTKQVICSPSFRTSSIQHVPGLETFAVELEYGLTPGHYGRSLEIDHIVPLELGGSNHIANLFPERLSAHPGYRVKDRLENKLHVLVCSGGAKLRAAQRGIASNWQALYKQVFGVSPRG